MLDIARRRRPGLLATSLLALAGLCAGPALAQSRTPASTANAIPTEITDVVSGGTWQEGVATGTYRVVTIVSGTDRDYGARVFIQWLQFAGDTGKAALLKSVPVAEFNELLMPHAVVTLEAEVENRAAILIAADDPKSRRSALVTVQAGTPGAYLAAVSPVAKH